MSRVLVIKSHAESTDQCRDMLSIGLSAGRLNTPVPVPWWNDVPLRLTT